VHLDWTEFIEEKESSLNGLTSVRLTLVEKDKQKVGLNNLICQLNLRQSSDPTKVKLSYNKVLWRKTNNNKNFTIFTISKIFTISLMKEAINSVVLS
jgi:hypothetical protein